MNHHNIQQRKFMSWPFCQKCGLVALHNRATEKALSKPCPVDKNAQPTNT